MPPRLHRYLLTLLCCSALLFGGCSSTMLSEQLTNNVSEQLYIDARLNFAIKHPLDWQRLQIPVSSPEYREDSIRWRVNGSEQQRGSGEMLIRSLDVNPELNLSNLLSAYLSDMPELESGQVEELNLPSGPALKLLGHDDKHGRLTIVIKGQTRDFIISLDYPSNRFEELLPTFQDIVQSFTEVTQPTELAK